MVLQNVLPLKTGHLRKKNFKLILDSRSVSTCQVQFAMSSALFDAQINLQDFVFHRLPVSMCNWVAILSYLCN